MLRTLRPVHAERTALQKTVCVALLFAAVFFVPYLITPPLTVSRSYVAGFSNRAALLILLCGTALFAWYSGGQLSRVEDIDSKLSWKALVPGLLAALLACLNRCDWGLLEVPGGECLYVLNRQQLLAAGRIPYKEFEFGYGPLLLYPGWWMQRLLHTTALRGYVVAWTFEAMLGVVMIWTVVRVIDLPTSWRATTFGFLVVSQVVWLDYGGTNYTPFRMFFAAFCVAVTHVVWTRTQNAWWMAMCSVVSVALSMACSVDQAIGVAFGLNAYLVLLLIGCRGKVSAGAVVFSSMGALACFAAANHWGMLLAMKSFGSGGYAYPVLPSAAIALALFAYVVAGTFCSWMLFKRRLESVIVPLTLGGVAMLPAALGRCDVLHVEAATPLFVVGVAAICAMPLVRRWWLPLATCFLIAAPAMVVRKDAILDWLTDRFPKTEDWADRVSDVLTPSGNQAYLSATQVRESEIPCDRSYFSPSLLLMPFEPFRLRCLDTGYYLGFTNVSTPATIEGKVDELRRHADQPLLMEKGSLDEQIPVQQATMESLHVESESIWVPRERHAPLTYAPVITYIKRHYVPGPLTAGGRLQIWLPRQSPLE